MAASCWASELLELLLELEELELLLLELELLLELDELLLLELLLLWASTSFSISALI